jgi:hypothetical protein
MHAAHAYGNTACKLMDASHDSDSPHMTTAQRYAHDAVTRAVVVACDTPYSSGWFFTVYEAYKDSLRVYDRGFAFAKAIAATKTTCTSSGNAYGCASAYAYAQAWSDATFKAHAAAYAKALGRCKCDKEQIVKAKAFGNASEFKKVVAKVEALAQSAVCVSGNESKSDSDAQTCVQDIYATVFAYVCHLLPDP